MKNIVWPLLIHEPTLVLDSRPLGVILKNRNSSGGMVTSGRMVAPTIQINFVSIAFHRAVEHHVNVHVKKIPRNGH